MRPASGILLVFFAVSVAFNFLVNACSAEQALQFYTDGQDDSFEWRQKDLKESGGMSVAVIHFTSQTWRERAWRHELWIVHPAKIRNSGIAFLLIAGSEPPESHLHTLKTVAEQSGALAAVVSEVPNQPMFEGRVEDSLIAYTFARYLETGDASWPLLFPMVKSARRACDVIGAYASRQWNQKVEKFVLGGASKRGWTTWLTAAVDNRVAGIAPMVFDMLNMKAQTEWARKVYGHQSERIHDYTEADLIRRIDEPRAVQLREWIDPWFYRARYTMPKLILLGTNDPYWTVDSMRHYWNDLPTPKLVFQTPNAGHGLGDGTEAIRSLAAFLETIAEGADLPELRWDVRIGETNAEVQIHSNQPFKSARLWMAESADRDFRNDHWESYPVKKGKLPGSAGVSIVVPSSGYRAFLMEAEFETPRGNRFKLSTQATVVPAELPRE